MRDLGHGYAIYIYIHGGRVDRILVPPPPNKKRRRHYETEKNNVDVAWILFDCDTLFVAYLVDVLQK